MTAMFIITSNNKTPQSLRRRSCLRLLLCWNNGRLMTAHSGRVCAKTPVSINNRGRSLGLCDVTPPRIWERLDLKKGILFIWIKKKHWVDFYHYKVVVYTHCQHTFQFKQHVKVNFASDDPFKVVARLKRQGSKQKNPSDHVMAKKHQRAAEVVIKLVQQEAFSKQKIMIKKRSSALYHLNPILDADLSFV